MLWVYSSLKRGELSSAFLSVLTMKLAFHAAQLRELSEKEISKTSQQFLTMCPFLSTQLVVILCPTSTRNIATNCLG